MSFTSDALTAEFDPVRVVERILLYLIGVLLAEPSTCHGLTIHATPDAKEGTRRPPPFRRSVPNRSGHGGGPGGIPSEGANDAIGVKTLLDLELRADILALVSIVTVNLNRPAA